MAAIMASLVICSGRVNNTELRGVVLKHQQSLPPSAPGIACSNHDKRVKKRVLPDRLEAFTQSYLALHRKHLTQESYLRVQKIINANIIPFFGKDAELGAILRTQVQRFVRSRSKSHLPLQSLKN